MGCTSCGSGGCASSKSAINKEDGSTEVVGCGSGGACSSCNRLNSYDWLSDMRLPQEGFRFMAVEVRFKGGRKEYLNNALNLELYPGDPVVVEAQGGGTHMGYVSLQGELVRLQMSKKGIKEKEDELPQILRIATEKDLIKYQEAANRELPVLFRTRQLISESELKMKLSDVEFQTDGTKATFFYSADERVDFRELIKNMASEFKIRVEMRQISLRQEAGRLGGIGSCGRELCCSTWLTDFKSVTTSAARYQNLSLNPTKLSGQCGRLKCCLNYELETYMEALKEIPTVDKPLQAEKGDYYLQKTDIFRKVLWFGLKHDNNWIPLPVDRVLEIQSANKAGNKVKALAKEEELQLIETLTSEDPINSDLLAMDRKFKDRDQQRKKPNHPNKNKNITQNRIAEAAKSGNQPQQNPTNQAPAPNHNKEDKGQGFRRIQNKPENLGQKQQQPRNEVKQQGLPNRTPKPQHAEKAKPLENSNLPKAIAAEGDVLKEKKEGANRFKKRRFNNKKGPRNNGNTAGPSDG